MKSLITLFNSLKRETSGGKFIPFVDGIRFVAILPVVALHANERLIRYVMQEEPMGWEGELSYLISRGAIGVMIFFALSGFVLSLPFAKGVKQFSFKKYVSRRLTRLEPPYIFWMTLFALVLLFKSGGAIAEVFPHYLASIFYLHNVIYQDFPIINPVAWSLEVEIQYYLLAPFLAMFYFKFQNILKRRIGLFMSIVGFIALQHQMSWQFAPFRASLLGQAQHFLVGMFMADIYIHGIKRIQFNAYLLDVLGTLSIVVMMFTWTDEMNKMILFSVATGVFFLSAFYGKYIPKLLSIKGITIIGGMCYTIYLTHLPLLELIYSLIAKIGHSTSYVISLTISLIIALTAVLLSSVIFYKFIERPFMKKDGFKEFIEKFKGLFKAKSTKTAI